MKVIKVKTFRMYFVFSKAQIVFRSSQVISALLILIFARFEFHLFIDSDLW